MFVFAAAPYAGLCEGFVKAAYANAGVSQDYLDQGSAKDGCEIAKGKAGWSTGGTPPLGAVVFWEDCSAFGHVCISRGGGMASSSGDGKHWNGSPDVSLSWLNSDWCGGEFTGWIMPYSAEEAEAYLRGTVSAQ